MSRSAHRRIWGELEDGAWLACMACAAFLGSRALARWRVRAQCIPDPELRRQALGSIDHKAFHSLGAATFGAAVPAVATGTMVRFVVAYQTISDYLDSLCDRSRPLDGRRRRRLHQAMVVALYLPGDGPPLPLPDPGDGGYLQELVRECRRALDALAGSGPGRAPMREALARARQLARLYAQMQSRKHGPAGRRRASMTHWAARLAVRDYAWWEVAAAAGSTLGIFALVAAGARRADGHLLDRIRAAYFPHVAALHILLDYAIDLREDALVRELNFAACYPGPLRLEQRLAAVFRRSVAFSGAPGMPAWHRLVVSGLPALYLTDPKASHLRSLLDRLKEEEPWVRRLVPVFRAFHRKLPAPDQVRPLAPASAMQESCGT